jgi:hypothetical protein
MTDFELTPEDGDAAADNTQIWTDANNAGEQLVVHPGNYYFYGTSLTPVSYACGYLKSTGSRTVSVGGHPSFKGGTTRFVQLRENFPLLRLRGGGYVTEGFTELVGNNALFTSGDASFAAAIEVEGNSAVATGRHVLGGLTLQSWAYGFDVLKGYYSGDVFVPHEAHADNTRVYDHQTFNVATPFRFNNEQAQNWLIEHSIFESLFGPEHMIVADVLRGGFLTFRDCTFNHPRLTALRIKDFSPNNCRIVFENFVCDRAVADDFATWYFTAVKHYPGGDIGPWNIEMSGYCQGIGGDGLPESTRPRFDVPSNMPKRKWDMRIFEGEF